MALRTSTVDTLVWVFIFGGLLVLSLGLFVNRQDAFLGTILIVVGVLDALAGVVLIVVRSRMRETNQETP